MPSSDEENSEMLQVLLQGFREGLAFPLPMLTPDTMNKF